MLRSLLIFAVSLAVLAGGFFFVWHAQSGARISGPPPSEAQPVSGTISTADNHGGIGPASRPILKSFEKGRLVSEFTAAEMTPQKDGSFIVEKPVSRFFMTNGQVVQVAGRSGVVYTDNGGPPAAGNTPFGASTQMPRNGTLKTVHIEIFPSESATRSTTQMDTDNIKFDNDTLRFFTDPYTAADGTTVPGDKVNVTVRGDDYEMDGKGLTLRWNGIDGHLQLLEIAHGQRLLIKNPSKMQLPGVPAATTRTSRAGASSNLRGPVIEQFSDRRDAETRRRNSESREFAKMSRTEAPKCRSVFSASPRLSGEKFSPNFGCVDIFGIDTRGSVSPWPDMLVSTDPGAVALATPVPAASRPPLPYRAVFSDNVKVREGPRQVALADVMTIDFLQGSDVGPTPGGTAAAAAVDKTPVPVSVAEKPVPAEAVTPVVASTGTPAVQTDASSAPTTKPATKPTNEPIEIFWTGPLVVKPLENVPPMMPLLPKQSVVRLVGSPAVLTPEGAEVRAASATYRSPDGAVRLQNSQTFPVASLVQMKANVMQVQLQTGSLNYDPKSRIATLVSPPGASSLLTMPMANQKTPMTVGWSQNGYIHTVVPAGQTQPSGADQIDLLGNVVVTHPTFSLDADELHINLAMVPKPHGNKGDTTEQPKLLTAIGKVKCKLISPDKPEQGIDSDKLTIALEQSRQDRTYPRRVLAEGNAFAYDPDQRLEADRLEIFLSPKLVTATTKPVASTVTKTVATTMPTTNPTDEMTAAVELESMHASSNVHAVTKDKSTADCDDMRVNTVDGGKQLVELTGDHGALLTNGKDSWLIGSVVHLAPAGNVITVDGAGQLHTIESPASGTTQPATQSSSKPAAKPTTRPAPPRPIDISWTDSMNVEGNANTSDIVGHVIVHTVDTGGVSTMTGDKAHIDFTDAPKPATQKTNEKKSADASAVGMGNKLLKRLTLTGHMHGESTLKDTDGKLLRHAELFGNQLVYTTSDHKAVIPGSGKLMVENHKPNTKTNAGGDTGNGQGNMNVVWKKFLVYDQTANVITIDGDTHTHFQQDAQSGKPTEKDQPMELDAQRLVVTLKDTPAGPARPASPGAKTNVPAPETGKTKLSHLFAVGSVHFVAKAVDFDAHSIDYDPDNQIMIARASDREPGETHDAEGRGNGTFGELVYDVQAQEVKSVSDVHATLRR